MVEDDEHAVENRTLRGLRVRQGDRTLTRFRTQKTASLLAYLAFHHDRQHPREVLAELIWPEHTPKSGRDSLNTALSSLRRQLEPPDVPAGAILVTDRFSVRLNPTAVTTDVAEFETALQAEKQTHSQPEQTRHLLTAVERYRGELLPGFYDEWIELERTRLEGAYLNALDQLVKHLTQARDFNRALDYARRAVQADPLREASHVALMRLLADSGQPAAALEQFRQGRGHLQGARAFAGSAVAEPIGSLSGTAHGCITQNLQPAHVMGIRKGGASLPAHVFASFASLREIIGAGTKSPPRQVAHSA